MSPTIWGDRAQVVCRDCGIEFFANWQPEMRPITSPPCWNCGGRLRTDKVAVELGQMVSIDTAAYRVDRPKIGDVVAIRDTQGTRMKRIVANPGQTVSVRDGLLRCDERSMSADVPWMIVHDDSHRLNNESWWESTNAAWSKTSSGFSIALEETNVQPAILLYGHRSSYEALRSDIVRDDYQGNLTETRQLRAVRNLGLKLDLEVHASTTIELWHWTDMGIRQDRQSFGPGIHHVSTRWENVPVQGVSPNGLDAEHPIGINVTTGAVTLQNLVVDRPLVYWVNETDDRSFRFPIRLGDDEYFVVGDNIPLSIDSRHTGAIERSSILGRVLSD